MAQNRTINQEVLIEVKSTITQKAIANARVAIKGYAKTETDFEGKAFFEGVPKGNYQVEIVADGFKNYSSSNRIKVTDSHNTFVFDLSPLPENAVSNTVRVTDERLWKELNINYVESFDLVDLSDPDNIWHLDNDERGWKSSINNGIYSLSSKEPDAVKYIWLDPKSDIEKNAASLEVKLDPHKESLAFTSCGLLLCFDQDTKHYYAYTITKDGEYHLFEKNEKGINRIFSGRKTDLNMEEFVKVGAILEETKMSLYINEELIKIHNFSKPLKVLFGVVAIGQGNFYFDNLSIYK